MSAKTSRRNASHPLADLVPPKWFSEEYIPRKYKSSEGEVRDVDLLAKAKKMKKNTLIFGPTGPGKTSCVFAYAAEFEIPLYSVSCNGAIEPRQLFGSWVPTEQAGVYKWEDGVVTKLMRYGGLFFINEINFMPPRVAASLYSVTDKRRTLTLLEHHNEVIVAHEDFQVIADYNPDYEGTRPLNEALKNRFAVKMFFDYDPVIEKELIAGETLLVLASLLRESHKVGEISTPISTNMLMEFEDISMDIGFDFAVENFLNAFSLDERPAVMEVMTLHRASLEADYTTDPDSDKIALVSADDPYAGLTKAGLSKMTVVQLHELADDFNIDLGDEKLAKGQLVAIIAAELADELA